MTAELIQAIGEWIVGPICLLIAILAWLYAIHKS